MVIVQYVDAFNGTPSRPQTIEVPYRRKPRTFTVGIAGIDQGSPTELFIIASPTLRTVADVKAVMEKQKIKGEIVSFQVVEQVEGRIQE